MAGSDYITRDEMDKLLAQVFAPLAKNIGDLTLRVAMLEREIKERS